jgi:hypothetical protein
MTATMTERLVTRLSGLGSRKRPSRRSFLGGAAVVGAALAVDPWGYLTRPQSAYASACGTDPSCGSGWTVMCCTINNGSNSCPPNTYPGGWWKADRSSFCGGSARYYIDCNALPGHEFACHCNDTTCDHRRVACNIFRYGQCNLAIRGVTAVVCRQISCTPPWIIHGKACRTTSATDNATGGHNAPCLTPTNTFPLPKWYPVAPSELATGHRLYSGQRLTSPDRHTTLMMVSNGNLAIYNARGLQWVSNTTGKAVNGYAYVHPDGYLCIVNTDGYVVWKTNTHSTSGKVKAVLRDDGNLVLYDGTKWLWNTGTHTP